MKLTDRQIYCAKCPDGLNQFDLRDDQVRGLVLRVYRTGVRTWFVFYRRREDNRRRWLKLGAYPALTLKQARDLAEIELGKVACGADPQAARKEVRTRPGTETMAEVAGDYLERYAKVHKRPAGYRMDRWQLDAYVLPRWGRRPVTDVTKRDVQELLEDLAAGKLAARGKPTKAAPRNLKALLSKLFDWAADRGCLAGNPAAGVKLPASVREHFKLGGRDRVLTDEEIRTLWHDLDRLEADRRNQAFGAATAAAFRLVLLTAQRPGEVLSMRWRDIEDGEWWMVPAEVAKNGEANRVYLSPQAREILQGLKAANGSSECDLESGRKPGHHLTTVKTAQNAIVRRHGMRHWTPHDLRRSAASKMRAMGVPRLVVQA
ncbi:MAG TPA: integrase arm-type DNA-binding domain-containing protein, partial [Actinomycetes bacterium]|nr:integrase arm-type DNA-binding domain-containing protein [Actinomycetes bacterium]